MGVVLNEPNLSGFGYGSPPSLIRKFLGGLAIIVDAYEKHAECCIEEQAHLTSTHLRRHPIDNVVASCYVNRSDQYQMEFGLDLQFARWVS